MKETVRWGICGAGNIAGRFAATVLEMGGSLNAIASTDSVRGKQFAQRFGIEKSCGYDDLAKDGEIDAVYVATNHPQHAECAARYLAAGKAVLCEKPMTINSQHLGQMLSAREKSGALLMEAMWIRFLPATIKLLELVRGGAIGRVRMANTELLATFSDKSSRAFSNEKAGGGLLDLGAYTLNLLSWILGEFTEIKSVAHVSEDCVDEISIITAKNADNALGCARQSVTCGNSNRVAVYGTEGSVQIEDYFEGACVKLTNRDGEQEFRFEPGGFQYEIQHFESLWKEGRTESSLMPLSQTARITAYMDDLREEWKLKFHPYEA